MWMNEWEIEQAIERFASHPVLGKGARFLGAFRDEVNAHSDGWPYWKLPARAADKLMTLLNAHMAAHMAWPRLPEPTEANLIEAVAPIMAFYRRTGYKAGMQFPTLNDPAAEREAEAASPENAFKPVIDALRVIVFTQHIREYLELYDPQALKQAIAALSVNANIEAELANAREFNTPEAAYGTYNRRVDELLERAQKDAPTGGEWAVDAAMAEATEADPNDHEGEELNWLVDEDGEPLPEKPFSVGRNDTTGPVTRHATLAEAEAQIVEIEKTDPDGVHAGEYYVDGPEVLINPRKPYSNCDMCGEDLAPGVTRCADCQNAGIEPPTCPVCDGPGVPLGSLGSRAHFRCRNCGIPFSHDTTQHA